MTDPRKPRMRGPTRTTRQDWLMAALDTLICEGVENVKILTLARKLDCARSSFYWYFKNRSELLNALLEHWATSNTKVIVESASAEAETINFALSRLYASWVREDRFDTQLDFAIRDWARRSGRVRRAVSAGDSARMEALASMFRRFGYDPAEATVRAQIVYFTQLGYALLDQRESWETRAARAREYLLCMTGQTPTEAEVASLIAADPARAPER